jgi:hypothetical protein
LNRAKLRKALKPNGKLTEKSRHVNSAQLATIEI